MAEEAPTPPPPRDAPPTAERAAPRTVVLIGLRASGKTSVGAALARLLDAEFVDLDDRTRARLGAPTVGEALRRAGEPAFREAEADALAAELDRQVAGHVGGHPDEQVDEHLDARPHVTGGIRRTLVLALGGGTPTGARAGEILQTARDRGQLRIVFLDPPLDVLAERLRRHAGDRPSLTGQGVVEEIPEIAAARRPRYAALADFAVRESSSVVKVAERIAASLATGAAGGSGAAGRSQR